MKKSNLILGSIALLLAILCIALWLQKDAEHEKMETLCQSSVTAALEDFKNYKESGNDSDYHSGVSEFRTYMNAYLFLRDNEDLTEYTWCNIVYGYMILNPQKVQSNIQGLIDALEYLASDYGHPNGFNKINNYSNELAALGD